jgi:hypothetical protein
MITKETNQVFKKMLIEHKQLCSLFTETTTKALMKEKPKLFEKMKLIGEDLCIIKSDFRCGKCKKEIDLQIHHTITRINKSYMPFNMYLIQRNYWANLILLCSECHSGLHRNESQKNSGTISADKIQALKNKVKA